jgi:hypothetical protein
MERRTLTIILGILLFVAGIPLIFMWGFISGGAESRYWQIDNSGLSLVSKDSLRSEYYHFCDSKQGIDTSDNLSVLIFFDTDFYSEPTSNNSMLSASQEPGYMGNPQKIKAIKISASDFYKTDYKDISNLFTNDSTPNYNDLSFANFQLYRNYHGDIGYHSHTAYVFNDINHLVYCFNQDNSRFDEIGRGDRFVKFNIDKNLFRQFGRLFKIKFKAELSDKTIERTYFYRLK